MLIKALITAGIILVLLLGWLTVQSLARLFAQRHPEWGPAREEGSIHVPSTPGLLPAVLFPRRPCRLVQMGG